MTRDKCKNCECGIDGTENDEGFKRIVFCSRDCSIGYDVRQRDLEDE